MERDNVRYKVSRKSKTGRINKKMIYLAATVTAIGVVGVSSHFISKDNKYSFNDKYSNYSAQLEEMMEVDMNTNLEDQLNTLQESRILIDSIKNDDSIVSRGDNFKKLIEQKGTLESTSLTILKMNIAHKYGVDASDITTSFDNNDGTWSAFIDGYGTVSITGDNFDLVNSIAEIQGYDKDELLKEDNYKKYVNSCDRLIKDAGEVAVDMSPKIAK